VPLRDDLLLSYLSSENPFGRNNHDPQLTWNEIANNMNERIAELCLLASKYNVSKVHDQYYRVLLPQLKGQETLVNDAGEPFTPWHPIEDELFLARISSFMKGGHSNNHYASWQQIAENTSVEAANYGIHTRRTWQEAQYHYYADILPRL
jgi:hypothetical protein